MKKIFAIAAAALIGLPSAALAVGGIQGQCADCHTMHNSEQGQPVAMVGLNATTPSAQPIQNLLRMDCVACHAQNTGNKTVLMDGGSIIPQVYHSDSSDLAAGNFAYIDTLGSTRKGHNVSDLFTGGDDNAKHYGSPPGKYYDHVHAPYFSDVTVNADGSETINAAFSKFTCAGAAGCHGTRSNLLSGTTNDNGTTTDTTDDFFEGTRRTGIAAVSGAHHNSYDGKKDAAQNTVGLHDGAKVAAGYRFIPGLKGTGNTAARWQNVDASSHNEYFGAQVGATNASCNSCHVPGVSGFGISARMSIDSTLLVPNQSMSGFCITCHGNFHSTGLETGGTNQDRNPYNGTSGAFLRHPSDYVIPNRGEYVAYTAYNITAPVARTTLLDAASPTVTPGTDLVMCLSCHQAHATEFDGMLRFDYAQILAGNTASQNGCLACHTTKGVAPDLR
ncbi:MAG: hypothetical protein IH614_00260 [Desulfuromonadales bacterium]|nr:hypothetical protein [Desulfuromonadales bacterium]